MKQRGALPCGGSAAVRRLLCDGLSGRDHGSILEGHNHAFAYFGGVPRTILYDNTKIAVARILGDGTRLKTRAFTELQSHYLFAERFGRPGKGNDKGKVEGLVGYARRNFMVPLPRCAAGGVQRTSADPMPEAAGEGITRASADDRRAFRERSASTAALAGAPYEACDKRSTRVTSMSLVRYRANDYSVPVEWGHREVLVKGFVHEVVICGKQVIARHPRSYEARRHFRSAALPGVAGTEDERPGPGGAVGWLDLPEGFRECGG